MQNLKINSIIFNPSQKSLGFNPGMNGIVLSARDESLDFSPRRFNSCLMFLSFYFLIFTFLGCATAPYPKPQITPTIPGTYHKVEKGQTLWRISKIYEVNMDDLVSINHISDATNIEIGQLIFIPNRQKQQYPTYKFSGSEDFIWPIKGKIITYFGQKSNNIINKGINIQPSRTNDILASRNGRVVFYSDNLEGYGKTIIIDHGDGLSSIYARNSQVFIKTGDTVQKGMLIAKAGSTARDRNIYLHFEIRKGYIPQNPYFYLSN